MGNATRARKGARDRCLQVLMSLQLFGMSCKPVRTGGHPVAAAGCSLKDGIPSSLIRSRLSTIGAAPTPLRPKRAARPLTGSGL